MSESTNETAATAQEPVDWENLDTKELFKAAVDNRMTITTDPESKTPLAATTKVIDKVKSGEQEPGVLYAPRADKVMAEINTWQLLRDWLTSEMWEKIEETRKHLSKRIREAYRLVLSNTRRGLIRVEEDQKKAAYDIVGAAIGDIERIEAMELELENDIIKLIADKLCNNQAIALTDIVNICNEIIGKTRETMDTIDNRRNGLLAKVARESELPQKE